MVSNCTKYSQNHYMRYHNKHPKFILKIGHMVRGGSLSYVAHRAVYAFYLVDGTPGRTSIVLILPPEQVLADCVG